MLEQISVRFKPTFIVVGILCMVSIVIVAKIKSPQKIEGSNRNLKIITNAV